jgi:hypothetical protein
MNLLDIGLISENDVIRINTVPNNACTRLVGLLLRSVRVFKQFVWLGVGSVKMAFSRPAHQRVTQTVRYYE